ncbi:hypothetical protein R6Q59_000567 [Mikania micrantha]
MGRARRIARREGHRNRSSGQGRPRYLGLVAQPSSVSSPTRPTSREDVQPATQIGGPPLITVHEEHIRGTLSLPPSSSSFVNANEPLGSPLVAIVVPAHPHEAPSTDRSTLQSSLNNQDEAGPSVQNSLSDFKTRFNTVSMRYKETITKTTKSWKERLFSRNNSPTDHGSKHTGEGSAGIATLSRLMDRLQQDLSPASNNINATTSFPSNQHRHNTTDNSTSLNEITSSSPPPSSAPGSAVE